METAKSTSEKTDVLIVGAGPTGLVLALWLRYAGVNIRVIDKALQPGTTSRALVIHARTLELYRQLGMSEDVVALGLKFTAVNLWVRGKHVARADLGAIGQGLTPYPEMLIFPQDQHERLLLEHLRRADVHVERGTELIGFEEAGGGVLARTHRDDGADMTVEARYIVGCDGAHSRVREILGIGFPGGTYERMFYVADVDVSGPAANHELSLALDDSDFLGAFPLKGENVARLIGTVKPEAERRAGLTWNDVSPRVLRRMRLDVQRVNWFSTYHVHHRVAERFRSGRAFLAGDAAHVHSPVGGQGMNTGIGDAVNLAWKLAEVVKDRAELTLLESYQPERVAFARRLVATTDRAFTFVSRDGWLARAVRTRLIPRALPGLVRRDAMRRFMFRTLSQTAVNYRGSALSAGKAGRVHGGDRLPWMMTTTTTDEASAAPDESDNHASLGARQWQVQVYGHASADTAAAAARWGVPVHAFAWTAAAESAGFARDAVYLVRPDGYVALAARRERADLLPRYFERMWMQATPARA